MGALTGVALFELKSSGAITVPVINRLRGPGDKSKAACAQNCDNGPH